MAICSFNLEVGLCSNGSKTTFRKKKHIFALVYILMGAFTAYYLSAAVKPFLKAVACRLIYTYLFISNT